jgi:hypothetical protein
MLFDVLCKIMIAFGLYDKIALVYLFLLGGIFQGKKNITIQIQ